MTKENKINWILRIAIFGEFLGHGVFAIQGKAAWIEWTQQLLGVDVALATQIIFVIGVMDIILAILVLVKPMRGFLLWMAFWGLWTAILRPIVDEPIWDFVERWANWGAPLALYYLRSK